MTYYLKHLYVRYCFRRSGRGSGRGGGRGDNRGDGCVCGGRGDGDDSWV